MMSFEKLIGQDLKFDEVMRLIERVIDSGGRTEWLWIGDDHEQHIINMRQVQDIKVVPNIKIEIVLTKGHIVLQFDGDEKLVNVSGDRP